MTTTDKAPVNHGETAFRKKQGTKRRHGAYRAPSSGPGLMQAPARLRLFKIIANDRALEDRDLAGVVATDEQRRNLAKLQERAWKHSARKSRPLSQS